MIKLVIFDLDDTLISEYDYIKSGYNIVAGYLAKKLQMDSKMIFQELWELFSTEKTAVFNRFFEHHRISYEKNDILTLVNCYRSHMPDIKLFDDVLPFLSFLQKRNIKTCIISDGYYNAQKNKIIASGLQNHIDKIYLTDEFGTEYWKPSDKCFFMAKKYFNLSFNEIMYIGDNPQKDFYFAKSIKISCVRIYRENGIYANREYLQGVKPQYYINSLEELKEILLSDDNVDMRQRLI